MNVVPEPKTVKHRVHIDVTLRVDRRAGRARRDGARAGDELRPALDRAWPTPRAASSARSSASPTSCPTTGCYELVIDCADPRAIAHWWADVFGCELGGREDNDWWWLEDVPGLPFDGWDFVPVPEPKTVKNRIHWDVARRVGRRPRRRRCDRAARRATTDRLDVMADPEGNEFCAFLRMSSNPRHDQPST